MRAALFLLALPLFAQTSPQYDLLLKNGHVIDAKNGIDAIRDVGIKDHKIAADAGSSGWRNFPDFKDRIITRSKTRILAFLNIVGNGMGGGKIEQNTAD